MGEPIIKRVNEFDPILGTEIEDTDLLYVVKPTATLPADIDRKLTATELVEYLNTKVSGGGGSGSGLDTLAVANELERTTGASVSLPNDKVNRDVFQNDDPVFCYLRESYVPSQGNTIKFDHGLLSEIKIIDDMNATTGWSGTNCSIGVSPSIKVEGTNSVTMTLSSFSGTATAIKTFTAFPLTDLFLAVSMRIGNIANLNDVSRLSVYIESSTNYSSEFYFDRASLGYVVDNFYRFTAPLNQTPDVVGSSGAAVLGSITKIAIKITTTNAISPIVYVDFITAISEKSFIQPTYSQTISIANGVTQESFTVTSENTTNNITKGTFTFKSLTQRLYFDIDFVTNNVISLSVNGVAMTPVPFDTDSSTTYTNLANQILTEFPDTVLVATADHSNRQILLTANDNGVELVISNISVIGGGTQASGATEFCLANSYTNDSTTTYISSNTGDVSNDQFKHKTTVTGDNLKNAKYHSVVYSGKMLEKATFESFLNIEEDVFEVSDLSNLSTTGEIILKQIGDSSVEVLRFKDGENFILFKDVRVGKNQQSPRGTALSNFYMCKQSADGTNSGTYITVTTDKYLTNYLTGEFTVGVPDLGADLTGYKVMPESAFLQVVIGSKTASTITRAWPKNFISKDFSSNYFSDNFNRADGPIGNGWSETIEVAGGGGSTAISGGAYRVAVSYGGSTSRLVRIYIPFLKKAPTTVTKFSFSFDVYCGFAHGDDNDGIKLLIGAKDNTPTEGIGVIVVGGTRDDHGFGTRRTAIIIDGAEVKTTTGVTGGSFSWRTIEFEYVAGNIKVYNYEKGGIKPASPQLTYFHKYKMINNGIYAQLCCSQIGDRSAAVLMDNFMGQYIMGSSHVLFQIPNIVNFDKLETITTNHRVDAVNQLPSILQKAEQVY